jgi:hypothetical protein
VWVVDGEQPSTTTLIGGAVVVVAVALQAGGEPHEPPVADEPRPAAAHP